MPKALIYITLLNGGILQEPDMRIYNNWKLIEIRDNISTIIPDKEFVLKISKQGVDYNLEINGCNSNSILISESRIDIKNVRCTMVCCDEEIGNSINYSGEYKISNDTLTIKNDRTYVFKVEN